MDPIIIHDIFVRVSGYIGARPDNLQPILGCLSWYSTCLTVYIYSRHYTLSTNTSLARAQKSTALLCVLFE